MRLHSKELGLSGRLGVPRLGIVGGLLVLLMLVALACDNKAQPTGPTATQGSPGTGAQTQQVATPTTTPTPQLPGSIKPVPASESYRLDLGGGVVVAFVESSSPEMPDKVAYVTHVPSGSQAMLDRDGQIIDRHDGRGDGPGRLDAVLEDGAEMDRILKGLKSDEDVRPRETVIDWVPLIQFGGIDYLARWRLAGQATREGDRDLTAEDLGPELYRIAFRGDGYVGADYRYQDGDSTYLNPGTPVYAVKGYSPEFRLATLEEGRVRLFESDTNPNAKTGEDLLDIRGKVTAIDILNAQDRGEVLGTIDEEPAVEAFVETVLESPVDQRMRDREGPRYFLSFHLADGISVGRTLWLESGELSRGVMTDHAVILSVWRALGEDDRPVATDGGPRISERLAARLGLAHLGFAAPEIVSTGKPHSPVVRLMRLSEFQTIRGSAPAAMDSDPLVWVVEVQGSWRDAGIVPEDKRQDFSVAVVALDAETGSTYGRSYTNTPLLGTSGGSRRSTPTPEPIMPGSASKAPGHIRLDLDNGVVVAFADDPNRGRIAYVTHVRSGAQVVLDREGKVLERHDSPMVDGDLLDATLKDGDSMKRIRRGLGHEGVLIRDPITTWVDVFHFGGASYGRASKRGDSVSNGERELDQSDLGPVVYRIAFCLSCNIGLPMGYQPQDGDAALLRPGTSIHSVKGHDPNLKLAAVVNGKVLLYERRP